MSSLVDRFIPHAVLTGPPDLLHRTRLGLAFGWVSAALFLVGALLQGLAHNLAASAVDVVCALALVSSSFVIKRTGNIVWVTHAALALIFVVVTGLAIGVRGAGLNGATLMLMVMPLFATMICGARHGWAWLGISLASGVALGLMESEGVISDRLGAPWRLFNAHLMLVIFTVVLFAVARVYEVRKEEALRSISELEGQRRLAELGQLRAHAAAELAKVEQFAALGRVAAAAAHELNNPLAYVISSIEFARNNRGPEDEAEVRSALAEAAEGAARINRIVRELGAQLRPANEVVTRVIVTDSLRIAIDLAKPHTAAATEVRSHYAEVPLVSANAPRLTQVLLSLLLNAGQAIPDQPGQVITIDLRPEGDHVCVEISHPGEAGARGAEGGLAAILGAAAVASFEGKLTFERANGRTIARLLLVAA